MAYVNGCKFDGKKNYIGIYVDEQTMKKIKARAQESQLTMSDIVRMALRDYFRKAV